MALTAGIEVPTKGMQRIALGYVAATTTIYRGGMLAYNATGYVQPAADTANFKFAGIALDDVDNSAGADGAKTVRISYDGTYFIANSSATIAWDGALVYATGDDATAISGVSNITVMGKCTKYDADATDNGIGEGVWIDTSQKA